MNLKTQFLFMLFYLCAINAGAGCVTPTGVAGQLQWVSSSSKVMFCEGSNWIDTSVSVGASCAGFSAGAIQSTGSDVQFCNGSNWVSMKGNPTGSGCTQSGQMSYSSVNSRYEYCDGANLYKMHPSSCAGLSLGGYCWYLGAYGQSCNTVCSTHGGVDAGTTTYAGSSGSNANCQSILNALISVTAVGTQATTYGCYFDSNIGAGNRRGTTTTDYAAAAANVRRACACGN